MRKIKLNSRGDTIVEVLIVLAVLGLAFTISSATASRGLQQARNAEEHSRAMGVLGSQTELLRTAVRAKDLSTSSGSFCIPDAANPTATAPITNPNDFTNGYSSAGGCITDGLYYSSISYSGTPTDGFYTLRVQWQGNGSLGTQQEVYTYRTHQLSSNADPGIPLGSGAPQIQVDVKKISPNSIVKDGPNPTPGCNSGNSQVNRGGEQLDLTGATSQSVPNIPASGVTFSNLVEFTNYSVTVSNLPGGFQTCTPTTYSGITAQSGVQKRTFVIAPVCTSETRTDTDKPLTHTENQGWWEYHPDYYTPGAFIDVYMIGPQSGGPANPIIGYGVYAVYAPWDWNPAWGNYAAFEAAGYYLYDRFVADYHPAWNEWHDNWVQVFDGYGTSVYWSCPP